MKARAPRPLNRRARHGARNHLLDVKIRTSTARRRRHETIGKWVFNILLVAAIAATSIFGMKAALEKFFFNNPDYTLQRITFDLDNIITREEALKETGLHEGVNIFSVDLSKIEATLKAIPEVSEVHVDRELPDHLSVTLVSRQAVAWIAEGTSADSSDAAQTLLVDRNGFLMRPRHLRPEYLQLPIIYGIKSDNIRDGEPLENDDLHVALSLIDAVSKHPESLLHIRTLDISEGYSLDVVNDHNAHIIFAPADFEEQLGRLQQLLTQCNDTGRTLATVNLMVKRNTPVTFVAVAAPIPEAEKSAPASTTSKTRKN